MAKIIQRKLAKRDFINIWHYTYKQWGEAKADQYLKELDQGIMTLSEHPEIGTACDHIRQGYRSYKIQHHILFYRLQSDEVEIVRVLHESMDTKKYL